MDPFLNIDQLIAARRSVFTSQFEPGKTIPDNIIQQLLENANMAPNHKLTEPWRFTVYTGNGLQTLADQQAALYKSHAGQKFKQAKYEQLLITPMLASHVIAIGMKRHADLPELEEIAAVACAVQNIYLSATAYGIGGYWSTGGITFLEQAKPLFGLEPADKFMGFFYLGYVRVPSLQRKPKPVEEKVKWVRE
ncbi:MAG: nitroreductase [Candidatus Pseudobacter hemicellulosilyticus]|uniref:Putative NAD(P)H nitroreductase n=1 Tax=Candidatus Pseudobacter hemicellulosilyticus TaxID=3121375 RepID=A0AAJ5WP23_9BACT|nr:MAG: nitroreductase [Pseudobacter sp.]